MAVFTRVEPGEARAFASLYFNAPEVRRLEPVSAGIENTNYFVDIEVHDQSLPFVLTLFEVLTIDDLAPVVGLMRHLAGAGLPVPAPMSSTKGDIIGRCQEKPAVWVPRIAGRSEMHPGETECFSIGRVLAQIHLQGQDCPTHRPVVRSLGWLEACFRQLQSHLPPDIQHDLAQELAAHSAKDPELSKLPHGWGHQDLFRDNALFDQGQISGLIDFYHACEDAWLLDLAITLNDWCIHENQDYDLPRMQALLAGYQGVRPLMVEEKKSLSLALRRAALRFWVSRLQTRYGKGYQADAACGLVNKDPGAMYRLIRSALALSKKDLARLV